MIIDTNVCLIDPVTIIERAEALMDQQPKQGILMLWKAASSKSRYIIVLHMCIMEDIQYIN